MNIRRVLCPTDLSSHSLEALRRAVAIARRHEAELHVLHAVGDAAPPRRAALAPWSIGFAPEGASTRAVAEPSLLDWVRRADLAGQTPRLVTRRGQPATAIIDYAKQAAADLIVMASKGRTGFTRLLHGSVAERVRLRASAPVLTVRLDTVRPDPCSRVLCAVDLSDGSEAAIASALALADEHQAALRLLHVIDRPSAEDVMAVGYLSLPSFVQERQDDAVARLRALLPKDARAWRQGCASVAMGSPAETILEAAREWSADLIVLGPQRRRGLSAALFGSTTETVVRRASAAVISGAPVVAEEESGQIVLRWQRVR